MSIDKTTAIKVAKLARIRLSDDDAAHYANELTKIMDWAEQLQKVNTDGVPLMTSVAEMQLLMRNDVVSDGGYPEAVVKNAPNAQYGCFTVPKVIE